MLLLYNHLRHVLKCRAMLISKAYFMLNDESCVSYTKIKVISK